MPGELIPLQGRRVVLVGGAGFIGHHLALRLKSLGAEVAVIDSLAINNYYALERERYDSPIGEVYIGFVKQRLQLLHRARIPFIEMDARDYHAVSEIMRQLKPDVIVQLAAVAHANRSNKDPYSTFDHSLRTLENALDVARADGLGVQHFIYFSSSMVYGNFATGEVREDCLCEPLGIYGALKFAGEKMVIAYNQVFDLPYTIIRPSALYGERCVSGRVGQAIIENALMGKTVTVMGDGEDRLDFTYVDDLVSGVINCIENENARNEVFNLTYGNSRSILEMVDLLRDNLPGVEVVHKDRDSLMPERGTLSVAKANRLIGYRPRFPLERGFVEYINWYKSTWQKNQEVDAGEVVYLRRRSWA